MSLPFTIIVPGNAPILDFNCDNNIYHTDIYRPATISNICLTLTQPLPDENNVLALYFSAPPYTNLQFLGAVNNSRPSDIMMTGFPLKQEYEGIQSIKLCIRLQTWAEIGELLQQVYCQKQAKKEYTKLVAKNLYNYMMSYNKSSLLINGCDGDYLVIPANFLDKWLQKFQAKYRLDPNFIYKTSSD